MREDRLLSPHRGRHQGTSAHDGKIISMAPNLMWGTDGTRVLTLDEGVWIFTAVEHWSAECVGWHVCKTGDRYAALQPISMALNNLYGNVRQGIARGLALRMDHGTQYLTDHFLEPDQVLGDRAEFCVCFRTADQRGRRTVFNRTLKEQALHGRVFRTVGDVRSAVASFVKLYNQEWRVEKNACTSPNEIRHHWLENQRAA